MWRLFKQSICFFHCWSSCCFFNCWSHKLTLHLLSSNFLFVFLKRSWRCNFPPNKHGRISILRLRTDGSDVITKFSDIHALPYFVTHGAPCAASRSSAFERARFCLSRFVTTTTKTFNGRHFSSIV